jgi:hypothetical protein
MMRGPVFGIELIDLASNLRAQGVATATGYKAPIDSAATTL